MALPGLAGSPGAAAALPGAGREGLAPFRPQPSPFPQAPTPFPGCLTGRSRALGTQLRRRGGRRSLGDVSSLRGYLYPRDWISFMKPGPGVSGRWGAGGEGASASCRLGGPRLGGGLPGRNVHGTWKTPALPARSRQGRGRATCAPLFSVPGAPPTPVQLLALCPRLWRSKLGH